MRQNCQLPMTLVLHTKLMTGQQQGANDLDASCRISHHGGGTARLQLSGFQFCSSALKR